MSEAIAEGRVARTAHRQSVQIADRDLVNALIEKLGARLLAFMVNRDPSTLSRWKKGEVTIPSECSGALRLIYQVFRMLESHESDHTIRAWFMGMNPQLDDMSPSEAVRDGKFREVLGAARAFLAGG